MGVDIETGSMTSPQRYILQADNGVRNDGYLILQISNFAQDMPALQPKFHNAG